MNLADELIKKTTESRNAAAKKKEEEECLRREEEERAEQADYDYGFTVGAEVVARLPDQLRAAAANGESTYAIKLMHKGQYGDMRDKGVIDAINKLMPDLGVEWDIEDDVEYHYGMARPMSFGMSTQDSSSIVKLVVWWL